MLAPRRDLLRLVARIGLEAAWAPALVLVVYVLTARGLRLFDRIPDLDIPMHLMGGMAAAYFFARSLRILSGTKLLGKPSRFAIRAFALTSTSTAAVLWESWEYASDQWFRTHEQLGLGDTMGDLLLGVLGGMVLLLALREGPAEPPETAIPLS